MATRFSAIPGRREIIDRRLIAEKIGSADWAKHLGQSESLTEPFNR